MSNKKPHFTYQNFYLYREHWFCHTGLANAPICRIKAYSVHGVWIETRSSIYSWEEFNNAFELR